jgi:hypothetical protein
MVETGHQPITAKNDPSDQESDVHLGSFLSATKLYACRSARRQYEVQRDQQR